MGPFEIPRAIGILGFGLFRFGGFRVKGFHGFQAVWWGLGDFQDFQGSGFLALEFRVYGFGAICRSFNAFGFHTFGNFKVSGL